MGLVSARTWALFACTVVSFVGYEITEKPHLFFLTHVFNTLNIIFYIIDKMKRDQKKNILKI